MSDFESIKNRVETMRRLHAEILAERPGSQERRLAEHKLAEFLANRNIPVQAELKEPFDPKRAAAGDQE